MSYSTWNTYGLGVCVDDIKTTPERLLKLASLDKQTMLDVEKYLNETLNGEYKIEELTMEDFYCLQGDFCEHDVSYVLSRVIKEIPVFYVDDYDGVPYILYCPTYPWNMTEDEFGITECKVKEIFQKYISILTDDIVNIEYQNVENGG